MAEVIFCWREGICFLSFDLNPKPGAQQGGIGIGNEIGNEIGIKTRILRELLGITIKIRTKIRTFRSGKTAQNRIH